MIIHKEDAKLRDAIKRLKEVNAAKRLAEKEEKKLKDELTRYGGKVITVGLKGDVETSEIVPEEIFMRPTFAQVLGLKIAERKGLDVENPRNLTKVVKLE